MVINKIKLPDSHSLESRSHSGVTQERGCRTSSSKGYPGTRSTFAGKLMLAKHAGSVGWVGASTFTPCTTLRAYYFGLAVAFPCVSTTRLVFVKPFQIFLVMIKKFPSSPRRSHRAGTAHVVDTSTSCTGVTEVSVLTARERSRKLPNDCRILGFCCRCHSYMNAQG